MSGLLTREAILAADDLKYEDVEVKEWGGTVRVRAMSGADRDAFEQSMVAMSDGKRSPDLRMMRAKLCACTIIDEAGGLLFGLSEMALLGTKSAAALERVFDVAQRLNGLGGAAVEDALGNSEPGQNSGSISDSPGT